MDTILRQDRLTSLDFSETQFVHTVISSHSVNIIFLNVSTIILAIRYKLPLKTLILTPSNTFWGIGALPVGSHNCSCGWMGTDLCSQIPKSDAKQEILWLEAVFSSIFMLNNQCLTVTCFVQPSIFWKGQI